MVWNRMGVGLVAFVAGGMAGWLVKPGPPAAVNPPLAKSAERTRPARPGREASLRTKATRHWMDRVETSGAREVAKEVPVADFKGLIEGLMAGVWGGMTRKQLDELVVLTGDWAGRDMAGALEWARGLDNPKQREVGLIAIAAKLAKTDPKAAFDIFAEVGEVTTEAREYLSPMMRGLYNEAAKQGVAAVLDLVKRTPHNGTNSSEGISIDYPEDFDFRSLIDGLAETTELGGNHDGYKPFAPADPFGAWATRDAEAAFDYVVAGTSQGQFLRWNGMTYELGKKWGSQEAEQWVGSKLAALTPEEQQGLLRKSDFSDSPGILRRYIATMPPEAAEGFRYQVLVHFKSLLAAGIEILNDVPEVEGRVATLERLRGVDNDAGLRGVLKEWKIPAERIEEILKTMKSPPPP